MKLTVTTPIYEFRTFIANLPLILQLGGTFKQRPHLAGTWIQGAEKLLGHKIVKYNPHDPDREKSDIPLAFKLYYKKNKKGELDYEKSPIQVPI